MFNVKKYWKEAKEAPMVVMSFGNQLTPGQPTARYQEPQAESCELVRHPGILLEVEGRDGRDVTASNTLEGA